MTKPHVVVQQVTVRFTADAVVLDRVSAEFARGRTAVLLGRSGAGKSTLLRCLNRLQAPTSGRVRVEGHGDLSGPAALQRHRRETGMVFQHHHLIGRASALDNVLTGRLGFHPWWRTLLPAPRAEVERAMECLERVGLAHKALQRADRLSGGERQRVGIARALVQAPRLVLADEPVSSLDPASARTVLDLLRRVCREDGLTAILSLHQLEYAREYAEHVVALARGVKVFDGTARHLDDDAIHSIYGDAPPELDDAVEAEPPRAPEPLETRSAEDADPQTLSPRPVL